MAVMTTVKLGLPEQQIGSVTAKAAAQGLTLNSWFQKVAAQKSNPTSVALQKTDPEEWARQFDAWADGHAPNLPVLSDEAISRDSICPDRLVVPDRE